MGAAVAYPVARAMAEAGSEVTVILGARNAELLILEDELRALPLKRARRRAPTTARRAARGS